MGNIFKLLVLSLVYFVSAAPLAKRMVDLTYVFDNDTLHHPMHNKFEIKVTLNGTFNEKYWIQNEEYNSGTHTGTHMDAPCHFAKGKWSIDQIPMERFFAPAAVVDIEDQAAENSDYEMTVQDLIDWEEKTGQLLNEVILLMRTGWGKRWGNRELYYGTNDNDVTKLRFPGMSEEAANWLLTNRNIYGIGIDTLSFDTGSTQKFPAHDILLGANIYGLENVANLDKLPLFGARLYVLPMKIGSASGAPTRIIATYPIVVY